MYADSPADFNVFNLLQLFGGVFRRMQVMLLGGEVTYFKMHYLHFEMEVVHFREALLAFSSKTGPKVPIIRGRPRWPAPLQMQIYEIFRRKARNVKTGGAGFPFLYILILRTA